MLNIHLKREGNYFELLKTPEWKEKRRSIIKRDDGCCTKCGSTKRLHVHHKYYLPDSWPWEYPNDALTTLCSLCHQKAHNIIDKRKGKMRPTVPAAKAKKKKGKSPVQAPNTKFDLKQDSLRRNKTKTSFADVIAQKRQQRRNESDAYLLPEYKHLKDVQS